MSHVTFTFTPRASNQNLNVLINGELVRLKKDQYGHYLYSVDTEQPEFDIEIFTVHELSGRLWFLLSYFYFLISIFGIFDQRMNKRYQSIKFKAHVSFKQDSNLKVLFFDFAEGQPAIAFEGDYEGYVVENHYYSDMKIKKRIRILRTIKWLTFLFALIAFGVIFACVDIF